MPSPATLPTLFGRFTAILRDHDQLRTTLTDLRAMCVALETAEGSQPSSLARLRLLEDLLRELSQHFAAEEADSYFGTIADEAPALTVRIGQLKTEHAAMLDALAKLCELAEDAARSLELSRATQGLISQLEQHERAESRLLRELFGQ